MAFSLKSKGLSLRLVCPIFALSPLGLNAHKIVAETDIVIGGSADIIAITRPNTSTRGISPTPTDNKA
ncbi:hypothetical protein, partial [Helicobacter sp. UBA3407]|uniref:hypothetical protein n=1 Tax=Helicobacter sp. UBA3407 TaxID=1946588 RepID=UPI0026082371